MIKYIQCVMLTVSILSVSIFGGKNIGLTKEIENLRELVLCSVEYVDKTAELSGEEQGITIIYPDSFWVDEDETTYLLGVYGKQVLEIKEDVFREIILSESILPSDIICFEEKLYIFDAALSEFQIYTKQGELLLRSKIELQNDYVKQLIKSDTGVAVATYGNMWIEVNPETGEQQITNGPVIPVIEAGAYDFAEYIATEENGTIYSVHTKLVENSSIISGELTLRAVSADGVCLGNYILPVEEYMYLPGKYIQVQENGNIYLLIPMEGKVEIRKVSLKEEMPSNMQKLSEMAKERESKYASQARKYKDIPVFSREEVRERAQAMAEYEWTLKKTHTRVSKSEPGVVLPRHIEAILKENQDKSSWSAKVTGIPYCWGGFYSLYGGVRGKTFQDTVREGFVTGNIDSGGYYKYLTTGLDCSGYVTAALGFESKLSTSNLAGIGSRVRGITNLQEMDILVYPGEHVIFFCEWMNEATMLVSEATIREGKVVTQPKSINELVVCRKYQMRSPW